MRTLGTALALLMWSAAALFGFVAASGFYEAAGGDAFIISGPRATAVFGVQMMFFSLLIACFGALTWWTRPATRRGDSA